ncbi:DUF5348 domain-containing protein [Enterococcus sp. DIV0660C]|uniref:DUF5348 domain-containing protein n=1 Tax=Enterococcus sp. DIV0660C TaxID=2230880 RepID=UPI001A8FFD75|nr:DUF5348 domain-containing protein [Enterococcus sp. DIV0660C]MBO0432749.1 DUF5348 domain-containing protein [Enterococcus sp. DIV0660C]
MKTEDVQREQLREKMLELHAQLKSLNESYYDDDKEKVTIEYPKNSEGRQLEQVHNEMFRHLMKVKKEMDYYSLPIIDTGVLQYDPSKERFIFKSVRKNIILNAGMYLEILVEDYFTEQKHWVRTRLEYLPKAAGGTHSTGWFISEDKDLELEGALARLRITE